nr:unnamed protein product [Callosobruchus chinensis]
MKSGGQFRSMFTSSAGPSGTQSLNAKRPFHRFKKKEDQKKSIQTPQLQVGELGVVKRRPEVLEQRTAVLPY